MESEAARAPARVLLHGEGGLARALAGLRGGLEVRHEPGCRVDQLDPGRLLEAQADVLVLSLAPSVADPRLRAAAFEESLRSLVRAIRAGAPAMRILALNCSSVDPADQAFRYAAGGEDTGAVRAHRFNLALLRVSEDEGVSIVDADRIVGELGGEASVPRFLACSEAASRAVLAEALRLMDELGVFVPARGPRRLVMPYVSRMAERGTVLRWHKQAGDEIRRGDALADVRLRLARIASRSREERIGEQLEPRAAAGGVETPEAGAGEELTVRLAAMEAGYLAHISAAEGSECAVGELLATVTGEPQPPGERAPAPGEAGVLKVAASLLG